MNVEIVLGSAVLSAAISGIISYMSARKNDKLHYITNERKNGEMRLGKFLSN